MRGLSHDGRAGSRLASIIARSITPCATCHNGKSAKGKPACTSRRPTFAIAATSPRIGRRSGASIMRKPREPALRATMAGQRRESPPRISKPSAACETCHSNNQWAKAIVDHGKLDSTVCFMSQRRSGDWQIRKSLRDDGRLRYLPLAVAGGMVAGAIQSCRHHR